MTVVRKNKKARLRRMTVVLSVSIIVMSYVIFNFVSTNNIIRSKQFEKSNLESELKTVYNENDILKSEVEKLSDLEYLLRYASLKLGVTKDNEIVVIKEANE